MFVAWRFRPRPPKQARRWTARLRVSSTFASMRGNICRAALRPIRSSASHTASKAISPCCCTSRPVWRRPPSRHGLHARWWQRQRRASGPMSRLWKPGLPATSTAPSPLGKPSSPTIRPTCSRCGSLTISISGWDDRATWSHRSNAFCRNGIMTWPVGARSCPAAALPMRNAATTRLQKPPAAPQSSSIPPICGPRTRLPMSWRCKIDMTKASLGSASWSDTGPAPTTCCIICGGTARCFTWSDASSMRFLRSTIAVFAT